jgi:hypothetical protein
MYWSYNHDVSTQLYHHISLPAGESGQKIESGSYQKDLKYVANIWFYLELSRNIFDNFLRKFKELQVSAETE